MYHKIETSDDSDNQNMERKFISFKSQFVPNAEHQTAASILFIDEHIINPVQIVNHIIFDGIVILLYLIAFISHILTLIALHHTNQTTYFWISLTLMIIGALINIIWAFFYAFEIIMHLHKKWSKIICYIGIVITSLPLGPLVFLLWVRVIENIKNHTKLINLLLYCLGVSFAQSILMITVMILIDYNMYYLISLISSVLVMIIGLICISIEDEEFTIIKFMPVPIHSYLVNDSFIFYCSSWIIDYISILFILIYCVDDSSMITLKIWIYNTLIGVPLISFVITYKEAKYFIDNFDPSHMSRILAMAIATGIFILYYIFFQIIVEMTCIVWLPVMYNYMKQEIIKRYSINDWHILQWIVRKDKIKRLCVINGLIMDEYHTYHDKHNDHQIISTQQYISRNGENNFKNVRLNGLKQLRDTKNLKSVMFNALFEEQDNFDKYAKFKLCVGFIFMLSRIVRFIVIPIIAALNILGASDVDVVTKWNIILYVIFGIQLLFIIIAMIIFIVVFNEIRYSLYLMGDKLEIMKDTEFRNVVDLYYDALPVYELHCMIKIHVASDIAYLIISYLRQN